MGAPPHLVLPDPAQQLPSSLPYSPAGSIFSPESSATSLSLSFSDSSSSSFTQSLPPVNSDPAPQIRKQKEKQQQNAALELPVCHENGAQLKQVMESSSTEPLRDSKIASTSCTKGASIRKACCRNACAFAADCAAISCCPCAVFSLVSLVLIKLPSALARKMSIRLQRRPCMKDGMSSRSSRGGENSHSIFTPTSSCREASEGDPATSIIRFSTQSLLEHFEAEDVGFGCLSQKRE